MKQIFRAILILGTVLAGPVWAQDADTQGDTPAAVPAPDSASIAAVVNGEVITDDDVMARARLLALSTGMPATPDLLARLAPQITKQLIDQTLQLQEINRRKVVVPESDIESAVARIEQGNNLPSGALRARLEQAGVPFATLIAQLRIELGWQTVLHQVLGPGLQPMPGDIAAEKRALLAQMGTMEYHISEIFIPVTDPADEQTAKNFASTVISQLRQGAPFPIVAAEFSQASSALHGGDMGFLSPAQLDPATAAVVTAMPAGAISDPVRVPGGYDIVQLQEEHKVGAETSQSLAIRQVFAPFASQVGSGGLDPSQVAVVEKLSAAGRAAHDCDDMTALNAQFGNVRPDDPGPVNLADVTPPAFQQLLATLPIGKLSQPLVARDGVSVVMVCSRQNVAQSLPSDDDIRNLIVERRVALESQQLLDDLRHRSIISQS
jgi:peptidyl-prolyl cis-trans isomerase SurA